MIIILLVKSFRKEELTTEYVLRHLKADVEFSDIPNPYRTKALEIIAKYLNMLHSRNNQPHQGLTSEERKAKRMKTLEMIRKAQAKH